MSNKFSHLAYPFCPRKGLPIILRVEGCSIAVCCCSYPARSWKTHSAPFTLNFMNVRYHDKRPLAIVIVIWVLVGAYAVLTQPQSARPKQTCTWERSHNVVYLAPAYSHRERFEPCYYAVFDSCLSSHLSEGMEDRVNQPARDRVVEPRPCRMRGVDRVDSATQTV